MKERAGEQEGQFETFLSFDEQIHLAALRAYAAMATSAARGAVRLVPEE